MAKKATSAKKPTKSASAKAATTKSASTAKTSTKTTIRTVPTTSRGRIASLRASLADGPVPVAALIAEFVGTFALAGIVLATSGNQLIVLFGLTAITLIVAAVSGAHLNPAITLAAWITRRTSGLKALGYIVAQVLGAMAAFLLLNAMLKGSVDQASAALTGQAVELYRLAPLTEGKEWLAFWAEVAGAALFGFGVAAAWRYREAVATAMTVGGSLFVALLVAGKTAVLNPAVAVAAGAFDFSQAVLWPLAVWTLAVAIGATAGMALYSLIRSDEA